MTTKLIRELRELAVTYRNSVALHDGYRKHADVVIAQADAYLREQERGDDEPDGMLPDSLMRVSEEWYELCERAKYVESIAISGELAEAIVETVVMLNESPTASAPADAPVAFVQMVESEWKFAPLVSASKESLLRLQHGTHLHFPPAPASGAVSDEDIEASARAIYATANKNYVGWPAAVQFSDDALRTFASRHASKGDNHE